MTKDTVAQEGKTAFSINGSGSVGHRWLVAIFKTDVDSLHHTTPSSPQKVLLDYAHRGKVLLYRFQITQSNFFSLLKT